ncbi:hypothetical protein SAY87_012743 [Trapa incisa]|uniref:C3H1-type domain-containing protein n=1 Tax=Trapa incisa TaxID=236973 RepID=A0AAN7GLF6_9MYRT|nr:hypothetical protein SAY87_012743 [Trapa incisa]
MFNKRVKPLPSKTKVCTYSLKGRYNRNPCRFLHSKPLQNASHNEVSHFTLSEGHGASKKTRENYDLKSRDRLCCHWASGTCIKGDTCLFQHSWFRGEGFDLLAALERHEKGITGIGWPSGSDKLYTGGKDGAVMIWDCHTGQCTNKVDMGSEVGSLICKDGWVFIGLQNIIKAWNIQTATAFDLEFAAGLAYCFAIKDNLLFAGCKNGHILTWRVSYPSSPPQLIATLEGQCCGLHGLGHIDNLMCITTFQGHTDVVMSLLCWEQYLLSCSLDGTVKVWAASSLGGCNLEVIYSHCEEIGVIALNGIHDTERKPILLASCNDDTVHAYRFQCYKLLPQVPSFSLEKAVEVDRRTEIVHADSLSSS